MKRVVVVGGGIVGFSAAVNIIEKEANVTVTLISEKLSPETTGDISAGLVSPYLLGDVSTQRLNYWCQESRKYFLELYKSEMASEVGVSLISGFWLKNETDEEAIYTEHFINYHKLSKDELKNLSTKYDKGFFFTTLTVECCKLLPYFRKRFEEKGGQIRLQRIKKLEHLVDEFDIIVNCTGFGARELVGDKDVFPIRGQMMRVKAPWIKHVICAGKYYIIPNTDYVILGGTQQVNDCNLSLSEDDSNDIRSGCEALVASLHNSALISEHVGLRPGRTNGPRVELETRTLANKIYHIIHNYGHGGCGVTLSWGCAQEVLKLLKECIEQ